MGHKPLINIWDVETMKSVAIIVGDLQKNIGHIAFSKNGKYLAATSMDDVHTIAIYDLRDIN